jgi:UDP-2,4-diacetamido-2,4,6-trideoxy-beta-L-altropyranose hydrolase
MRVVIRADASLEIGAGHIMRCLALAEILKNNGAHVQFICRKHKGHLIGKIISKGFSVLELKVSTSIKNDDKLFHSNWLGATQKKDSADCLSFLKQSRVDWLIVDHYGIDEVWQRNLKGYYQQLMVIDDLADRKHQCDILLDQTFGRVKKDYKNLVSETCELILGSKYALLRPEFNNWRSYSLNRRKIPEIKELLINMGGMDTENATEILLHEIAKCILPKDINITIVLGSFSKYLESIETLANELPYKVNVKVEVSNLAEIMANSDIAIGSSGSSTWERCCLGLPTIQLVSADNQFFLAQKLSSHNIVKLLEHPSDLKKLLETAQDWFEDFGNAGRKVCSGLGVYKIFNKLTDLKIELNEFGEISLESYANISEADKVLTLNMRNHSEVKKFMFNKKEIPKNEHINFIQKLADRTDIRYFLIKQNTKVIGSINFTQINLYNSVEFGIYTNPFEDNKNAGKILESVASNYAFNELGVKKILLKVLNDNKRAINFYKKSGFRFINNKKDIEKDFSCMEKLNTNKTIKFG